MVSAQGDAARRADASPFGSMADVGAAVMAQCGMPLSQIGAHLGDGIGDQAVRAAIVRGRRQLAAKRVHLAAPSRAAAPEAGPASASPVPDLPAPDTIPDADPFELLLLWAERGPQRAATLASKARTLLAEIAQIQHSTRRKARKQTARTQRRHDAVPLPPNAPIAERRLYYALVRDWAAQAGLPIPDGKRVGIRIVRAYEAARAAAEAGDGAGAGPAVSGELQDAADASEPAPILVPASAQSAVAFEAVTQPFLDALAQRHDAAATRMQANAEYLARVMAAACAAPAAAGTG